MEGPTTKAGRLTEQIMKAFSGFNDDNIIVLETSIFNKVYSHVLEVLEHGLSTNRPGVVILGGGDALGLSEIQRLLASEDLPFVVSEDLESINVEPVNIKMLRYDPPLPLPVLPKIDNSARRRQWRQDERIKRKRKY